MKKKNFLVQIRNITENKKLLLNKLFIENLAHFLV